MAATEEKKQDPTFRVSIDAEAIERQVTDTILKSALGDRIKKAIEDALAGSRLYGDPIKDAVAAEVNSAMIKFVRDEYADRIREKVREQLTDENLDLLVNSFVITLIHGDNR